jgi:ABC-2 type transport system permease protein
MSGLRNVLSITRKDLLILFKDWGGLAQLFLLPLVFVLIFGGLWSVAAASDAEEDTRIPLPVVNLDSKGQLSQEFLLKLNEAGGLEAVLYENADAENLLTEQEIKQLLTIPDGFSQRVTEGEPVTLILASNGASDEELNSALFVVEGVARDMTLETQIFASLEQMGQMNADAPKDQQIFTPDRAKAQAQSQFDRAATTPLVRVIERYPETLGEDILERLSPTQVAVSGMTVLFVFLTAQVTASSIYYEKKVGTFRRLLAAPIRRSTILSGKVLPNFIIVLLQVIVIFGVAVFLFPLIGLSGLDLGNYIPALVLLVVAMAICSTALGVLIAAVAKTEAQIGGISQAVLWVLALLGGAIVPTVLFSESLATIGQFTPQYWAVTGFYDLLIRGKGIDEVILNIGILLVFAVIFFAVGVWRFDFD